MKQLLILWLFLFAYQVLATDARTIAECAGPGESDTWIPADSLQIQPGLEAEIESLHGQMIFKRRVTDYPLCMALVGNVFRVPKDGVITLIPVFAATWIGTLNSRTETDVSTGIFVMKRPGSPDDQFWLLTNLYQKVILSYTNDGGIQYYGTLQQSPRHSVTCAECQPKVQMRVRVSKGQDIDLCVSYLMWGTEIKFDGFYLRYVPDRELTTEEQGLCVLKTRELKEIELTDLNAVIRGLTSAKNFRSAFLIMEESCRLLYEQVNSVQLQNLLTSIKKLSGDIPAFIVEHRASLSAEKKNLLVRLTVLAKTVHLESTSSFDEIFSEEDRRLLSEIAAEDLSGEEELDRVLLTKIEQRIKLQAELEAL